MSNCIRFAGSSRTVLFRRDEIDVEALKKDIGSARAVQYREDRSLGERRADCFWWYLQGTTTLREDGVSIRFGTGRSDHTWRDFKWLLQELSAYVLLEKEHKFVVFDEFDGFAEPFEISVLFKEGRIRLR